MPNYTLKNIDTGDIVSLAAKDIPDALLILGKKWSKNNTVLYKKED